MGLLIGFLLISLSIIPYIRYATKKRLEVELASNNIINESLSSIIDIKLTNSENFFKHQFHRVGKNSIQIYLERRNFTWNSKSTNWTIWHNTYFYNWNLPFITKFRYIWNLKSYTIPCNYSCCLFKIDTPASRYF